MSADVDMLPRQWNNESNMSSIPVWKRNLVAKKINQQKNGLKTDEVNAISESSALKSVLQRDAQTTSFFYLCPEDSIKEGIANHEGSKNAHRHEIKNLKTEGESILPVHQNPILLQDLERRSKDQSPRIGYKPHQTRTSAESSTPLPVEIGEDSVFGDASKIRGDDHNCGGPDEVIYGRGFVHRLLLKFSSLAHQQDQHKPLHQSKTSHTGKSEERYNSEPVLSSKVESKKTDSGGSLKVDGQNKEAEDKSFSDGEDKIEPVSNTLCMFEKLFCSRRRPQEDQKPEAECGTNGVSPPTKKSPGSTFASAAEATTPVGVGNKMQHSISDPDNRSHPNLAQSNFHSKLSQKERSTPTISQDLGCKTEPANNNNLEGSVLGSPVDVKLVTSLFEAASCSPQGKQSFVSKEEGEAVSRIGHGGIHGKSDSAVASTQVTSSAAHHDDDDDVPAPEASAKKIKAGQAQLRQHKRHSSKDYLEIKQSDDPRMMSKDYKQPAKLPNRENNPGQKPLGNQHPGGGAKVTPSSSVARPGKLLIRSSATGAALDVASLPRYNDIKTGEFVPASRAYVEEMAAAADDDKDDDLSFEFEGAGMLLEKSMLVKTRNTKNMKILFNDATTTVHEYPSEQSMADWFGEHAEG